MDDGTNFGSALIESLQEVAAWKRGEVSLPGVTIDPMSPQRVRSIRRSVAKSTKDFERRFGISAATMNNWEQGRRKLDPAARLLLRVIEFNPHAVEQALKG